MKNAILALVIFMLVGSSLANVVLFGRLRAANSMTQLYSGGAFSHEIMNTSNHIDDFQNDNAYYYKEVNPNAAYYGITYLVRDSVGIRTISEYDIKMFTYIKNNGSSRGYVPNPPAVDQ